jgi:hypothetical protein
VPYNCRSRERERERFTDLVLRPPAWTDSYYSRDKKQEPVDQLVDAPYFADSRDVALLQLADFIAYFLRRYAELENGDRERYAGERLQVTEWARQALACSIPKAAMYPKRNRCECADFFYGLATPCLRD